MIMDICLCLHSFQFNVENVKERMQGGNCVSFGFTFIAQYKRIKKTLCFLCGKSLANGYIKQTKLNKKFCFILDHMDFGFSCYYFFVVVV